MGSRIRSNTRHILECFCEIAPPENTNQQPWILQKYPESFNDPELLKQVCLFSFPCEISCNGAQVQHFSFVLTSVESKWTFGFCRHAPNAQTALVIISYLPWHELFFKILNQIAELIQRQELADLKSFLEALYDRDVPGPGTTLHIPYGVTHQVYTCKCPNTYALPSIPENRNLTEYFSAVEPHNMMIIFASMLHERRIVMISSKISRLSACIQAANSIIYPLIWQHIYIPVLPPHLSDYLTAPMPYLAGVPSSTWQRVRQNSKPEELGKMVILDVDTNRIETPFSDLESLPPDVVSGMRRRLKPTQMMGDSVARVFLRALVQIIGGYRDALRFRQGEQITFCDDAFLHSRPAPLRPFLESMLELQIFRQFIEERLEMLNSGQGFSDEFELEACLYSDKSSGRLKEQYKEWSKTMRKEGVALFKTVRHKTNPAMRSAVKAMKEQSRSVKEKSRTAYKDIRSKFKDLQVGRDAGVEDDGVVARERDREPARSAPSSPKVKSLSAPKRGAILDIPAQSLARRLSASVDPSHGVRHYRTANGSSPGLSGEFDAAEAASSSSDDTSSQELHELPPLNLDLVEDMKDILFRTSSISTSGPPAVDRSRKPSLPSLPVSPSSASNATQFIFPPLTSPQPLTGPVSPQSLPLPPPRCRKRVTASPASPFPQKDAADADLIRLDYHASGTGVSPLEEFDPLGQRKSPEHARPAPVQMANPLFPLYSARQTAVPQVEPRGNGVAAFAKSDGEQRARPQAFAPPSANTSWTTFD